MPDVCTLSQLLSFSPSPTPMVNKLKSFENTKIGNKKKVVQKCKKKHTHNQNTLTTLNSARIAAEKKRVVRKG
jgi:hypothetical protein